MTHPGIKFEYKNWKVDIYSIKTWGTAVGNCEIWNIVAEKDQHKISDEYHQICSEDTLRRAIETAKYRIERYEEQLEKVNIIKQELTNQLEVKKK